MDAVACSTFGSLALRLVLSRCSHLGHFASAFLSRPRSYGPRGSTFAPSWCADVCAPCSPCSKAASSPWEKSSSHRFGHQESSTPPWHQSRVDQCGSRTGRRDLPMVVVEFNRGAGSDAVVALDARVRGASLEKACCAVITVMRTDLREYYMLYECVFMMCSWANMIRETMLTEFSGLIQCARGVQYGLFSPTRFLLPSRCHFARTIHTRSPLSTQTVLV